MDSKYIFGLIVISWVGILEVVAMLKGINGQYFGTALAAICTISAGIIGYTVGKNKQQ
jgi:hypothetical protein